MKGHVGFDTILEFQFVVSCPALKCIIQGKVLDSHPGLYEYDIPSHAVAKRTF